MKPIEPAKSYFDRPATSLFRGRASQRLRLVCAADNIGDIAFLPYRFFRLPSSVSGVGTETLTSPQRRIGQPHHDIAQYQFKL